MFCLQLFLFRLYYLRWLFLAVVAFDIEPVLNSIHLAPSPLYTTVVPTLDGNSEISAHMWSKSGNFICLRHLLDRRLSQI